VHERGKEQKESYAEEERVPMPEHGDGPGQPRSDLRDQVPEHETRADRGEHDPPDRSDEALAGAQPEPSSDRVRRSRVSRYFAGHSS
jgi:hypothetical protein